MSEVEMRPGDWRYAIQCAGVARRAIKQMHPRDRKFHDTTVDECDAVIKKIRDAGAAESDEKWVIVELSDADVRVIREGLIDIVTIRRDKTPENYKPATRWSKAREELPTEHTFVRESLP